VHTPVCIKNIGYEALSTPVYINNIVYGPYILIIYIYIHTYIHILHTNIYIYIYMYIYVYVCICIYIYIYTYITYIHTYIHTYIYIISKIIYESTLHGLVNLAEPFGEPLAEERQVAFAIARLTYSIRQHTSAYVSMRRWASR
jgi:hypothetical protein